MPRRAYIEWSSAVAVGLVGVSDWLDARFEEARELAYQSVIEAEKEVAG
jgi:hypothetical protein